MFKVINISIIPSSVFWPIQITLMFLKRTIVNTLDWGIGRRSTSVVRTSTSAYWRWARPDQAGIHRSSDPTKLFRFRALETVLIPNSATRPTTALVLEIRNSKILEIRKNGKTEKLESEKLENSKTRKVHIRILWCWRLVVSLTKYNYTIEKLVT